jgi:hypothetical protein
VVDGRRAVTGVTLTVLAGLLVVGGLVGWRALSAPVPGDDGDSTGTRCDAGVAKGDLIRTRDVTVSVYNAGNRSGLAGQTQQELAARGFIEGDVGNAPADAADVRFVRVLTTSRDDPAARLVARQFGKRVQVSVAPDLGAGVEVIVGNRFAGLVKAPRSMRAKAAGSGC